MSVGASRRLRRCAVATLREGDDSPLSVAWFTCRSNASTSRASALMLSPSSSSSRSPGTTSADIDLDGRALADDERLLRDEALECLGGLLGAELLPEGEDGVDDDDGEDRPAELGHAAHEREHAGDPEHDREEVVEVGEEPQPQRLALRPSRCRWDRSVQGGPLPLLARGPLAGYRARNTRLRGRAQRPRRGRSSSAVLCSRSRLSPHGPPESHRYVHQRTADSLSRTGENR